LRSSNEEDPALGPASKEICAEIEADRKTLERLMEQLEIHRGRGKPAAAWAGEKLGRLKLNGQLTGYSPLSRVAELELLYIGISGKLRLWAALGNTVGEAQPDFDFAQLAMRAEAQRDRVEALHLDATARAFDRQPVHA
jgi:hypothetical protein